LDCWFDGSFVDGNGKVAGWIKENFENNLKKFLEITKNSNFKTF